MGRQLLDIQGAIDFACVKTAMIEAEIVDAKSTIRRPEAVEATYPPIARNHAFLDHARYHQAVLVQERLE